MVKKFFDYMFIKIIFVQSNQLPPAAFPLSEKNPSQP